MFESGDAARARALLEEVVAAAAPGPRRARALCRLATVVGLSESGRPATRELLERALAEAGQDDVLRCEIELALSWIDHVTGALPDAARHAREALRLAERSRDATILAEALAAVAFLRAMLGGDLDLAAMEHAVALEQEAGRNWALHRPRWLLAVMPELAGRCEESQAIQEALRDLAVDSGDVQSLPFVLTHLARVRCNLDAWEQAVLDADEADRVAEHSGQWEERDFTRATSAMLAAHRGEMAAARALAGTPRKRTTRSAGSHDHAAGNPHRLPEIRV